MHHIFYRPEGAVSGDYIPFYWNGEFQLFYLLDRREPRGHLSGISWHRVSTRDFVTFHDCGEAIAHGGEDEQDLCAYTGSVIRARGQFHIFYTGHNPLLRAAGKPEQAIMHAVSDDLDHWTKIPEHTFFAPESYEMNDWRDPFVFFDAETDRYHMLLAARQAEGPKTRRGCTAHLTSTDLTAWTLQPPLWAPDSYYTHECPDLFRMGDWYYLLFSEFTDQCRTRYVMSRNLNGPWLSPPDDVFDTRAYYAAKSFSDGQTRYLFGWNPTREADDDFHRFQWGGNLVVHELYARADGTLAVREPQSNHSAWDDAAPLSFDGQSTPGVVCLDRADGLAVARAVGIPQSFRLEMDVCFTSGTRSFGMMTRYDEAEDSAYGWTFAPAARRVGFDAMPRPHWNHYDAYGLDRTFDMLPDRDIHLSLTVVGTMATLYIDNEIAFTTRMYNLTGKALGLFVQHGRAEFKNIRISTVYGGGMA